jgi:AcrR family transcriptional regulator
MAAKKTRQRATTERKNEQALRDRIVGAAFGAFMENGYAGTSTLEIATRAKVSKRELYALFENKEAMLKAGITARTAQMGTARELPEARDRAMLADILAQFGARVLHETSHPHVIAVHRLAIGEYARAPEIAQILSAAGREATKRKLASFLAKAQAAGLVAKGDVAAMVALFVGLLWSDLFVPLLLGAEPRPDDDDCRRRARSAAAQFLALNPARSSDQARR